MKIDNPWASALFLVIPLLCFFKKKVKRATIIVSTINPLKQANTKFRYKYHDLAFGLRLLELFFLIVAVMNVRNTDFGISRFSAVAAFLLLFLEIFMKNTFWRTLP